MKVKIMRQPELLLSKAALNGESNMSEWKELNEESKKRWNTNAAFWDEYMGETNNQFHNELIKPMTEKLLEVKKDERIIDIACGHGNFSRRLAELKAQVLAIDYSSELIDKAKKRSSNYQIDYRVIDATDRASLEKLGANTYDSAVSNMALMDMSELMPLAMGLGNLLKNDGKFVFSVMHPCFQNPDLVKIVEEEVLGNEIITRKSIKITKYIGSQHYEGIAINKQPVSQIYFHRPLSVLLGVFFEAGFCLDKIEEPVFYSSDNHKFDWNEIPAVIVCRLRKLGGFK